MISKGVKSCRKWLWSKKWIHNYLISHMKSIMMNGNIWTFIIIFLKPFWFKLWLHPKKDCSCVVVVLQFFNSTTVSPNLSLFFEVVSCRGKKNMLRESQWLLNGTLAPPTGQTYKLSSNIYTNLKNYFPGFIELFVKVLSSLAFLVLPLILHK